MARRSSSADIRVPLSWVVILLVLLAMWYGWHHHLKPMTLAFGAARKDTA